MSAKVKLLSKIAMSAAILLFLFGCDESSFYDDGTYASDEDALTALFLDDADVEAPDVWQDGSEGIGSSADELRQLDDPIEPLAWWRIGHRAGTTVTVEFDDEDHATLTRVRRFNGDFRLLTEVSEESMETLDKPMYNELVRRAYAIRIGDSPYPRRNWRIVEITPEVMRSVDPNPNTVELLNVTVVDAQNRVILDITDPLETYFDREDLPRVAVGEQVTVYVETEGAFPGPIGMLRPNVYANGRMPRLQLRDDGVEPDMIAEDGIYSGTYVIGPRVGLHHVGLDFIDYGTIYDDEAPYNSTGWGIPYAVVRSL
ncbi:MAG: hypothetical protein H6508_01245 [Calditrichaeota bacterium]|nr:hypothetical protein [Calditrichota bacterium]MCB9365802.1 hypothetical protein [Calditrichota bacterium]